MVMMVMHPASYVVMIVVLALFEGRVLKYHVSKSQNQCVNVDQA